MSNKDDINKEDYPSNSVLGDERKPRVPTRETGPVRDREEEPVEEEQVRKIIKYPEVQSVRVKKPTFLSKVGDIFFGNNPDSVAHYVVWDVLIPAAKDTVQDMVTKGIEMLLYGESTGRPRRRSRGGSRQSRTVISYGNYYGRKQRAPEEKLRSPGPRKQVEQVLFGYAEEAQEVFEVLLEILDQYGQVTVAEFYEVSGLPAESDYIDTGWGWKNLSRAKVIRTREGYSIAFPEPIRLD